MLRNRHCCAKCTSELALQRMLYPRRASSRLSGVAEKGCETVYQEPRLWDGELLPGFVRQLWATSAASSLALCKFLPSYQKRAEKVWPWTMTLLDQAVRPPKDPVSTVQIHESSFGRLGGGREFLRTSAIGDNLEQWGLDLCLVTAAYTSKWCQFL